MTDVGNVKKDFKAAMVKMCQQQFGIHLEQIEKSRIRMPQQRNRRHKRKVKWTF